MHASERPPDWLRLHVMANRNVKRKRDGLPPRPEAQARTTGRGWLPLVSSAARTQRHNLYPVHLHHLFPPRPLPATRVMGTRVLALASAPSWTTRLPHGAGAPRQTQQQPAGLRRQAHLLGWWEQPQSALVATAPHATAQRSAAEPASRRREPHLDSQERRPQTAMAAPAPGAMAPCSAAEPLGFWGHPRCR